MRLGDYEDTVNICVEIIFFFILLFGRLIYISDLELFNHAFIQYTDKEHFIMHCHSFFKVQLKKFETKTTFKRQ